MALIIGVVIVLLILFGFLCYKKAPPTEAIVVTGFGLARPKVVCGKGALDDRCVIPAEIKAMSKEELTEKIAEYEKTQKSLKNNEAEIKLPIHIV